MNCLIFVSVHVDRTFAGRGRKADEMAAARSGGHDFGEHPGGVSEGRV